MDTTLLGKSATYPNTYDPTVLFPIARAEKRLKLGIEGSLPFTGHDEWMCFELSWLNLKGKPVVYMARIKVPCESEFIFESKSMKLYCNSFNNSRFADSATVRHLIEKDLSDLTGSEVKIELEPLSADIFYLARIKAEIIDDLDIEISEYLPNKGLLKCHENAGIVSEFLASNLVKSNCLVTNQPDWGTILIKYEGRKIDREALLKYLIAFRNHNEFAEQFTEEVFVDIMNICKPNKLMVQVRYTRRGGIDINPIRTNDAEMMKYSVGRLIRQ